MKITKGQFWALLVAVLMFGSIFALIQYQDEYTQNEQPAQPQNQTPTALQYSASGISAKVIEVFPRIRFGAKTPEAEVSSIDSMLIATGKILQIENSQFSGPNAEYYVADIKVQSADKIPEAIEAIMALASMKEPEFMKYALVSIPQKVELKNDSLGITQEYQFKDGQMQALIGTDTIKGDSIEVSLQAGFSGQQLIGAYATETQNAESKDSIFSITQKFALSSPENQYFISSEALPPKMASLENAKVEFEKLDANAQIEVSPQSLDFTIAFSEPEKISAKDLNFYFSGYKGIESFELQLDANRAIVTAADANISEFAGKLEGGLNAFGYKVAGIQEPKVLLQGIFSNQDSAKVMAAIASVEKSQGIKVEAFRKARVEANSVFVPDANYSFAIPQGYFDAYVKPSRKAGDEVELSVFIIASKRNGVKQIQGQEITESPLMGQGN